MEKGSTLREEIKRYQSHGVSKETLASQITSYFKPLYLETLKKDKTKATTMKSYILNAYVLLGYDKAKKQKDMDEWIKQEEKKNSKK